MARRVPKLEIGSLVGIPLSKNGFAIGQVLVPGDVFYLGVDPAPRDTGSAPPDLEPRLFAWTTDGELFRGNWTLLEGKSRSSIHYPRPEFKLNMNGRMIVESFDGRTTREFEPERDQHLNYRSSLSPLLLQDAVNALNGDGEWLDTFDKLLFQKEAK